MAIGSGEDRRSFVRRAGAVKRSRSTIPAHMEPEHRRAVRARLAQLLGQKLEKVVSPAALQELSKDARRLGKAIETLQTEFGVKLDPRAIQGVRTVNHLVTLVADAARKSRREAPPAEPAPASPLESLLEKPAAAAAPAAPSAPPPLPSRQPTGETYRSPVAYQGERIHAAAIYCSDGRIGDQVDDFLHNGLGLPRYDRVACPGGPVALAGRLAAHWEARGVEEQLRFLAHVHAIRRVVLISHSGCAYYSHKLSIPADQLEREQKDDLQKAVWAVQRIVGGVHAERYFARVDGAEVVFEAV